MTLTEIEETVKAYAAFMGIEENSKRAKEYKSDLYKQYLEQTDYVVIKITEAQFLVKNIDALVDEYKDVIKNREEARKIINELENEILKEE